MKELKKYIKDQQEELYENIVELKNIKYTEDMLLEMANISQQTTGLDVIIWVQTDNTQSTGKHNLPRVKFQNNTQTRAQISEGIPMSISDEPTILLKEKDMDKILLSTRQINKIKKWIIKNQKILLKYWKEEITTDELLKYLQK